MQREIKKRVPYVQSISKRVLTLSETAQRLGLNVEDRERVSKYERGFLEPPSEVLCAYAEVANVYVEAVIKDEVDLPKRLPSKIKSEGIKREKTKR